MRLKFGSSTLALALLVGCSLGGPPPGAPPPKAATPFPPSATTVSTPCPSDPPPRAYARVTTSGANVAGARTFAAHPRGGFVVPAGGAGILRVGAGAEPEVLVPSTEVEPLQDPANALYYPLVAAAAPDGTLFAIGLLDRLYKIAPDGRVTSLKLPHLDPVVLPGLAVDPQGNAVYTVLVPDYSAAGGGDNYVARWNADGTTTVLAGKPGAGPGFRDGRGAEARFHAPSQLAFDGAGNLYVADTYNGAIRRIAPDGEVTTLVGGAVPSPQPSPPGLSLPPTDFVDRTVGGLAVSRTGDLFYSGGDWRIHQITAAGVARVLAGTGHRCAAPAPCPGSCTPPPVESCHRDGPLMEAEFDGPGALACGPGDVVYVMDGPRTHRPALLRTIE